MRPLAVDLFCGLGGWTEGFLSEGYRVVGFDIERHDYGTGGYPGQLVLQDVTTLHGSQFKDAAVIVASPPCQAYSYRAMPWKRAKALPPPDNTLFETCFRIQREACEAAGRYIPLIVENVRGAQKWVGRAKANFGSYYLWGDVGMVGRRVVAGMPRFGVTVSPTRATKWGECNGKRFDERPKGNVAAHREGTQMAAGVKGFTLVRPAWAKPLGKNTLGRKHGSRSKARKAASAAIAKIPFPLAQYIAKVFKTDLENV
jgi:hypothetical protein